MAPTLAFARRLAARQQLVWVRFVLVPGWTDDPGNVAALARFTASLGGPRRKSRPGADGQPPGRGPTPVRSTAREP